MARLKDVRARDFKSFAGEVKVSDLPALTFIIGPNGVGKSNLFDAIGFALLLPDTRVNTIQDYITTGAPLCEVQLCFSTRQEPSTTTTVTRQVTRRGGDIFFIDGRVVDKADYQGTLEGLGLQPSFVKTLFISQGLASQVLTPARISAYLEAMSGSSLLAERFKSLSQAVHDTTAELKEAIGNLTKLKKQLQSVEYEQAANKKYTQLLNERRSLETSIALTRLYYLTTSIDEMQSEVTEAAHKKDELSLQLRANQELQAQWTAKLNHLSAQLTQALGAREATNASLQKNEIRKTQLASTRAIYENRLRNIQVSQERYEKLRGEQDFRVQECESRLRLLKADLKALHEQIHGTSFTQLLPRSFFILSADFKEKHASELSSLYALRATALAAGRARSEALEASERASEQLEAVQSKKALILKAAEDKKQALRDVIASLDNARKSLVEVQTKETELRTEREKNDRRIYEINGILDSQFNAAADAQREREYAAALGMIRTEHPNSVYGSLDALISVRAAKHRDLIDMALGKYRKAIVCDAPETASACIQALRQGKHRPLVFLPIKALKGEKRILERDRGVAQEYNARSDVKMTPILDMIEQEDRAAAAVRFVLKGSFFCDSEDIGAARDFLRSTKGGARVLMRNNVQLNSGGILSCNFSTGAPRAGGRQRERSTQGSLAPREQDQLRSECANLQKRQKDIANELQDGFSEISRLQHVTIPSLEAHLRTATQEMERADASCHESAEREAVSLATSKAAKEALETAELAYENASSALREAELKCNKQKEAFFRDIMPEVTRQLVEIHRVPALVALNRPLQPADVEDADKQQKELAAQRISDKEKEITKQTTELAVLKHDYQSDLQRATNILQTTRDALETCKQEEREAVREIERLTKEQKRQETELQMLQEELKVVEEDARKATLGIDERQKEYQESEVQRCALLSELREFQYSRLELFDELYRTQVEIPFVDAEILDPDSGEDEASTTASEELFRIILEKAALLLMQRVDENVLTLQLDEFAAQLSQLKPLYTQAPGMLTAFKNNGLTSETCDQLVAKYNDKLEEVQSQIETMAINANVAERHASLVAAVTTAQQRVATLRKELALKADEFRHVRGERRSRFKTCLDGLNKHLSETYQDLAYGERTDRSNIELTASNEEAPWAPEALTYTVIPYASQLTNSQSLSGGERTLAFMALVFAFQRYRPTPFLLLDEVDSAIDSSNQTRLRTFLRSQTETNVIAVSHQAPLFAVGDLLLGITRIPKEHEQSQERELGPARLFYLDLKGFEEDEVVEGGPLLVEK